MQSSDYKPLRCQHCGRQLALATPTRILFSHGCYCDEPVPLKCSSCGARRYWRPVQKIDAIVYTEGAPV